MELVAQVMTQRGGRLLAAHLESLDPEAALARERLEVQLGSELTRKLLFALAPHTPRRRTKSQIPAKESSAITIANAPLAPTAKRP